jgi:hypothetical protein
MLPKVLLVELGDSHNEVLFTQVQAFRESKIPIGLFLNERLRTRVHPAVLGENAVEFRECEGIRAQLLAALRIRALVNREGYSHVVVNTASGNAVRLLSTLIPRRVRAIGVLHDACKAVRSGSQAWISRRFRDYLVLADHLVPNPPPRGLHFAAFYPIAFPVEPELIVRSSAPPSSDGAFRIAVPGNVSYARRDYRALVELWNSVPLADRARLEIEILGNIDLGDGPAFLSLLQDHGLRDAFTVHHGFVPESVFYERLAQAHAVMPLIHPATPDFDRYVRCKISGAFNLAYGFRKPILMHERFSSIPDFKLTAIFYTPPKLPPLDELKPAHARIVAAYAHSEQFDPQAQQARYRRFVLGDGQEHPSVRT